MKSTPSGENDPGRVLDTKPYIQHHPIVGYQYTPNTEQTLPRPGGGTYTIRVNAAGIRSDRPYSKAKPPGVRRLLVFGDSYAAGQYASNDQRFTELLERRVPNLEVINFALEGTGTDQQLLIFENLAAGYEFDAVLLFPFLQNIRRNLADSRLAHDPKTKQAILRPKPRFELVNGRLELRNVPVSPDPIPMDRAGEGDVNRSDSKQSLAGKIKSRLDKLPGIRVVKKVVYPLVSWEPFPEYKNPTHPSWKLMEAIIRRFKESAGDKPLVIVPVVYSSYVVNRMGRSYLARFKSLEAVPGIYTIDTLPYFKRLGKDGGRSFLEPYDCHFSAQGHLVMADALQQELTRLKLLP